MNFIAIARELLEEEINNLQQKLIALQLRCPHENLHIEYHADTGNYDRSSDCYWRDYSCKDCGKKWREHD